MKSGISKYMTLVVLATSAASIGISFAEEKSNEVELTQEIFEATESEIQRESNYDGSYSDIMEKVEERLKVEVYAVVPFKGKHLYTVFTTKGAYTVDKTVSIAFKGKVIEIATGQNIQGEHLDQVKDVIKSKIEQRSAIEAFTSRQSTAPNQSHVRDTEFPTLRKLNPIVPPATVLAPPTQGLTRNSSENTALARDKVVELSPEAFQALKKQTSPMERMKHLAKERTMEYPGAQYYAERKRQNDLKMQTAPVVENADKNARNEHDGSEDTASILNTLKNLPDHLRRQHGPKYAPKILTNISDEQFVVYEPNEEVKFRGTLTVATDFTCPYCKMLHSLVPNLTEQGVRVRYMPYPRSRIMNYEFSPNFTIDQYIARTKTEPLNQLGQLAVAGYCSEDNAAAFNELFATKSLTEWPSQIADQCEGTIREFKILGDLLYGGSVPYMVWSNNTGDKSEMGTIKGVLKKDRTIDDLLERLEF